jgi:DNA-directed RNA polymerase subunit RPC12/RpoP
MQISRITETELDLKDDPGSSWIIHRKRSLLTQQFSWKHSTEPLKGEVFSSYLTRVLKLNFAEPIGVIQNLENKIIIPSRYDIDLSNNLDLLEKIADLLNQDINVLKSMCLFPKGKSNKNKLIINDTKFCPYCLVEDEDHPYFRYYWRLNFITICEKHNCYLLEKCPNCESPIRYWETRFDHSIVECYNCGWNITRNKDCTIYFEKSHIQSDFFVPFQEKLIDAYEKEVWNGKNVEREKFFRKFWRLVWIINKHPEKESSRTEIDSWEKYMKWLQEQTIEVQHQAILKAYKTLTENPERIEKPFICEIDGLKFAGLALFLRHIHTHKEIRCPLEECKGATIIYHGHYRCERCGTEFDQSGQLIEKGKRIPCPIKECGSTSISRRKNDLRCNICGTRFTKDGEIIHQGGKKICPLQECGSSNTRILITKENKDDQYRCYSCGTIFDSNQDILQQGKRIVCSNPKCNSTEVRIRSNGYKCEDCGSLFDKEGKMLKIGKAKISNCPLPGCGSNTIIVLDSHFSCYHCGTLFDRNGNIIKEGKRLACPLPECRSNWIRTNRKNEHVICKKCGTEFSRDGIIIKPGKLIKTCPLPSCKSHSVRADADYYVCIKCGTKFSSEGEILFSGEKKKCPLEKCGSTRISYSKRNDQYLCKACGTIFLDGSKILMMGERKLCPFCKSSNTRFKERKADEIIFSCYSCATEFSSNDVIIKKGRLNRCIKCGSTNILYRGPTTGGYRCKKCGLIFA